MKCYSRSDFPPSLTADNVQTPDPKVFAADIHANALCPCSALAGGITSRNALLCMPTVTMPSCLMPEPVMLGRRDRRSLK